MKQNIAETVLGAVIIVIALYFLVFSYSKADVGAVDGYHVVADFTGIGGLAAGDEVQISGVKIGTVSDVRLNQDTYLAEVEMSIASHIKLPDDTTAMITSAGLLGGRFMQLEPGASEDYLSDGGKIEFTQAPQNLEQLLGKFIFSMQKGDDDKDDGHDDAYDGFNGDGGENL